ncbi:Rieske (2Fe-2S) protein [Bacteroidota bacterium]
MNSKLRFFFLFISLFLILLNCQKDKDFRFPYVPVNLVIDIPTELAISPLEYRIFDNNNKPYYDTGYGGIIVFKTAGNQFKAYDAACTHEVENNSLCSVESSSSAILVKCPCCNSVFELVHGNVSTNESPARYPLHEYNVSISAYSNQLFVSN